MAGKVLVNSTYGADDPERATVPFIVASASAAGDNETVVFLTSESVQLVTRGGASGPRADGYPPVEMLIDETIQNGGKIWVCPACANARGITEGDLIEGAEIAGAARAIGFLNEGARTIM